MASNITAAAASSALAAALAFASPAAAAAPYKALGTEPFWSLSMGSKAFVFEQMDGPTIRQKAPRAKKTRYGHVYWTRRLQVAIVRNQPCSDGMSDYIYRDDVKVTADGRAFRGRGLPRTRPGNVARP